MTGEDHPFGKLNQLKQKFEGERLTEPFTLTLQGKQVSEEEFKKNVITDDTLWKVFKMDDAQRRARGIDEDTHIKFKRTFNDIRQGYDYINKTLRKEGKPFDKKAKQIQESLEQLFVLLEQINASKAEPTPTPSEVTPTPAETLPPRAPRSPERVRRTVELTTTTYHSAAPNSFAEVQTLKFTPQGLDQILTDPSGPLQLKKKIDAEMKSTLHQLPMRKSLEKLLPTYKEANDLRKWLNFTLINARASSGRIQLSDMEEYVELLKKLDAEVRGLPEATVAELTAKAEKPAVQAAPEAVATPVQPSVEVVAPEATQAGATLSMSGTATARMGNAFPTLEAQVSSLASVSKEQFTSFTNVLSRLSALKEHVDTATQNPAALVTALQQTNSAEYPKLYAASLQEFTSLVVLAQNGADPDPAREQALMDNVNSLEAMSERIAAYLNGHNPLVNPAPTPEHATELGSLKEKRDAYMAAKAAYEKGIDAHYGQYRSNTGPFAERMGRGMRKLFGLGPKHESLDPLYKAMNDARVAYSQTRFGMMDARINRMYNKDGKQGAEKVAEWHEQLKRREIVRTIQRSSEGFIERQYDALSPAKQAAIDAVLNTRGDAADSTRSGRMQAIQFAVGALSGALLAWKTKTAIATGGISLVAGAFGYATGNMAGNAVEWWKNRRLEKLFDEINDVAKAGAERVDFDTTAEYDKTLRRYGTKIIATEESRNAQSKAARVAGAVAGGLVAGSIANDMVDAYAKKAIGDISFRIPEGTGGIEVSETTPKSGPELVPSPDTSDDVTAEKANMYHMVKGDNPWDLVEEKHFSEKFDGLTKTERDSVIDSAIDRLRSDDALRERIFPGYTGTSFTDMQIGQEVNLAAYEQLVDEQLELHEHNVAETRETVPVPEPLDGEGPDDPNDVPPEGREPDVKDKEIEEVPENNSPTVIVDDEKPSGALGTALAGGLASVGSARNESKDSGDAAGVSAADITRERLNLYTTLHDTQKSGGFFSSLFGRSKMPAHEFLGNMSMGEVSKLSQQRPEYIAVIASQNNVDEAALQNWTNYMKQLAPDIATRSPNMTFAAYVDVVSEELAKHSKQA